MATVPAHRIKQFGVEFYQAAFPAKEIDRLVKFEVLGYGGVPEPAKAKRASRTRVNWACWRAGSARRPRRTSGR